MFWLSKKYLRMGSPGGRNDRTCRESILTLSRGSQLPYTNKNKSVDCFYFYIYYIHNSRSTTHGGYYVIPSNPAILELVVTYQGGHGGLNPPTPAAEGILPFRLGVAHRGCTPRPWNPPFRTASSFRNLEPVQIPWNPPLPPGFLSMPRHR